jgi:hypothetical protein
LSSGKNKERGGVFRGQLHAEADVLDIVRRVSLLEPLQVPRLVAGRIASLVTKVNGVSGDDNKAVKGNVWIRRR